MSLNGCSKKLCPMQVGTVDDCNLTKEQCPYFTQDVNLQKVLNQIKAELAREIFEEIENEINNELQNNYKVLPQFEFSNELWNRISGRIDAFQIMCEFIAELKKKYTGDQT